MQAEAFRFRELGFEVGDGEDVLVAGDCSVFVLDEPAESLAEERVTLGDMRILGNQIQKRRSDGDN